LINQKVLRQQLVMEGCVVDTANNGKEALEKIMQSKFAKKDGKPLDVVLMDMEMPVMGGVEATKRIRQLEAQRRTGHIPIIGISANARSEQCENISMII
jgi:CheY-like chemotaxis protein